MPGVWGLGATGGGKDFAGARRMKRERRKERKSHRRAAVQRTAEPASRAIEPIPLTSPLTPAATSE